MSLSMTMIWNERIIARLGRGAALAGIATLAFAAPSLLAQRSGLMMLDRFEAGQWEVRARDTTTSRSSLCIDNGRDLVQLRHAGAACRSVVIEDTPSAVTIQYTCPGNGYGRTRIRMENARLAQIETQGIAQGLPFDYSAEARRVGSCTPR